ncbi:MAG: glycosyltransferase [Planctomycetota bacterium]
MKILHFKRTMRAEDGGVVKAVLDLSAACATEHSPVTLATTDPGAVPQDWSDGERAHVKVEHLGKAGGPTDRLDAGQAQGIHGLIESSDVVHLHSMWSFANIQVAAMCRRLHTPYVLSVHGMLDDWCMSQRRLKKLIYLKTFNRNLIAHAAAVHCTAQAELDQVRRWIPDGRGVVVPLPLDLSEYETLPEAGEALDAMSEIARGVPIVLFLSRIHYKKGLDRLIEASALLHERGVAHQLVIAGTGDDEYPERMRSLATERGIEGSTPFVGFVSGRQKVALLRAADLFALPTSQENFGFVYFEALASGTRVLTTRGTDTWPELESSGAGTIADNTPVAFAHAIQEMLGVAASEVSRAEQAGRDWVFEHLAPDRVRDGYLSLYAKTMQGATR